VTAAQAYNSDMRTALLVMLLATTTAARDPLADDIAKWHAYLESVKDTTDERQKQMTEGIAPIFARAEAAFKEGHRELALQRLASARVQLAAAEFVMARPKSERSDQARFEAEWKRAGHELRDDLRPTPANAFASLHPAAVRAQAEATQPQVKAFYNASLEYSRNTDPFAGLYYVGNAFAQKQLAALCRQMSTPASQQAPPIRSIAIEIASLQHELLKAYRPPASIDRHSEFIGASALLKEARDLDASGLRYGALLRYLQAVLRTAPLLPPLATSDVTAKLNEFEARMTGSIDHTIARQFLDAARMDPANAAVIANEVLPRYFAAIGPAPAAPKNVTPAVTVTLVRWPFT